MTIAATVTENPFDLPFDLPAGLAGFDADFMTDLLRHRGLIAATNRVVRMQEAGVGMTAGYFSALKKVTCSYLEPTPAPSRFVIKTWPELEIMPREAIRGYFRKDVRGYAAFAPEEFYPRPHALLAAYDEAGNRWALVMEDAETFATHKVHEAELTLDETRSLIPRLVDIAVRWEGCDEGDAAARLVALDIPLWASPGHLGVYQAVMPGGAPLLDKLVSIGSWISPTWDDYLGKNVAVEFTRRLRSFFERADPARGATCTLTHGDLRGDNLFLAPPSPRCPDGWVVIDFQHLCRGPIPSDLAYLMNSGSVLPEVYTGEGLRRILRDFYDAFIERTRRYPAYTYAQFEQEYATMSTVLYVYFIGMGAAIWQAGAFRNELAARVELGNGVATEMSLTPEERRQRMWWRKTSANFRETFKTFGLYDYILSLPLDDPPPIFIDLPAHLR